MGELIEHLKPNFFIPGAAKSGTTTLHDMLNTHPEISMSSVKEPGYWKNKNFKEFGNTELHSTVDDAHIHIMIQPAFWISLCCKVRPIDR